MARRPSAAPVGRGRGPLHAVILAGGAGERFWPASRRTHPKPFLQVLGGRSLLEATLARARRFARADRIWIVCGHEHARAVRAASGLPANRVLVEPRRRNTAAAVTWAALRVEATEPGAVMAVLPADHHIPDSRAFAAAMRRCGRAAHAERVLVTLGVLPTRPETGYGYVEVGEPAPAPFGDLHRTRRFVEKPDRARARRFLTTGRHRWNAGIFVWSAATFLEELRTCAPDLHRAFSPVRRAPRDRRRAPVEAAYRRAPSRPVDVAVLEKSHRVWTLPVEFAWSDVGSWASLADQLGVGRGRGRLDGVDSSGDGNRIIAGDVLFEGSRGNLVWGADRPVALLGVDELAVVDAGDVILVTKLDRSQDVRKLVARLVEDGRRELT